MKMLRFAAIAIVVSAASAQSLHAQNAAGSFRTGTEKEATYFEFEARAKDESGAGYGVMTFSGPLEITGTDEDAEEQKPTTELLSMKIEFDCVRIEKNRATMSGLVRDASIRGYAGKRFMLSVEDGGFDSKEPDKFTWGVYGVRSIQWFPTDAELKDDDGWRMVWVATDYERDDDKGMLISRETDVDCRSFPLDGYEFIDVLDGDGKIEVSSRQ